MIQKISYLLTAAIFAFALSGANAIAQQPQKPLTLGVFPYVSPGQLVNFHTDLKDLFEDALGRKVVLVTAPSFKEFVGRTKNSSYDYILTAPHLGRLAEVRDGYRPIAHTMHDVQGIYLAKKSSDIFELKDLEGKVITLVGRSAIITQMVEKQLNGLGLYDGKNISFRITNTHNNAMYAPLRGESDASVTGILLWRKIGLAGSNSKVRVIGRTPVSIGFQVMAAKSSSESDSLKVQKALLNLHNTEPGKVYMDKTGFESFDIVSEQDKNDLDPYIQIFLKKK
ncbi:MAG: phosphate/phosphite/phosphonate ABC transporter substrate-binding protein [Arenicellales bacterium]